MRARLIAIALLAVGTVGLGGMAATSGANAQPGSTPDTYVNYWDAVGSQAFTAAKKLSPRRSSHAPGMSSKGLSSSGMATSRARSRPALRSDCGHVWSC